METTYPFRFEDTTDFYAERIQNFGGLLPHWHSYCEIDFIDSGQALHTLNGHQEMVHTNSIVVMSTSDFHSYTDWQDDPPVITNIRFNEDLLSDDVKKVFRAINGHVYHIPEQDAGSLRQKIDALLTDDAKPMEHLRHRIMLEILLLDIAISQDAYTRLKVIDNDPLMAAFAYIEQHFREAITLEEVSKIAAFAPTYFSTLFHERFGATFRDYIISRRLEWSRLLIEYTNVPITTICFDAGFSSSSYFGRCFRQKFGISPSEARKKSKLNTTQS